MEDMSKDQTDLSATVKNILELVKKISIDHQKKIKDYKDRKHSAKTSNLSKSGPQISQGNIQYQDQAKSDQFQEIPAEGEEKDFDRDLNNNQP